MQPTTPTAEGPQEHVLTASGEFDVHDEPIDLGIYRFEDWISFAFFWLLAGTVFLQFFTRYALNDSAGWTEEIARYLLICTVFIGAAVSVRKNNHIQVDFFYRILPKRLMRVMSTLVDAVRIAFFAYAMLAHLPADPAHRQPAHGGRRPADRDHVLRGAGRLRADDLARDRCRAAQLEARCLGARTA